MGVNREARLTLSAMPQPGWGGTTLAGFTESMAIRPEFDVSEGECAAMLGRMVAAGLAVSLGGEPERWELTEAAHMIVTGPAQDSRTDYTAEEVMLALEPAVGLVGSTAEAQT